MTYGDYLTTSEMNRWILDTDIPWDEIDPELARSQPELLDRVRASALIESFFPIFTPRALDLLWDNVAATAIYSVQLYEIADVRELDEAAAIRASTMLIFL